MVALDVMHKLVQELLSQSTAVPLVESPLDALSPRHRGDVMGRWACLYGYPLKCQTGHDGKRIHRGCPCDCSVIAREFRLLSFEEQAFWLKRLDPDNPESYHRV